MQRLTVTLALSTLLLCSYFPTTASADNKRCRQIRATLFEEAAPELAPGLAVETIGTLRGSLRGTYHFQIPEGGFVPAVDSSKLFYQGESSISTRRGALFLIDTGTIDTVSPGYLSALADIEGGTGRFEGASGQLFYSGNFDNETGTGTVKFSGFICTQRS